MDDVLRILTMVIVLTPAALLLPRRWGICIADLSALLLFFSPKSGKPAYHKIRQAFGLDRRESLKLAWQSLRQPYRDFVILKRVSSRREEPAQWELIEKNAEAIDELRKSGRSYIVATAHFLREAVHAPFDPEFTPGNPIWLSIDLPGGSWSVKVLRMRIQYGTMLKNLDSWGRLVDMKFIGKDSYKDLVRCLRKDGNVLFISIDAPWQADLPGAYCRDFAGEKNRAFPTGAARIARLARCPIVGCVFSIDDQGRKVVEWGRPIYPEQSDDTEILDELLGMMEVAVGKRPSQYVLPIGGQRRWVPDRLRWEG